MKYWNVPKRALPMILVTFLGSCGADYSVEDAGSVQDCSLAPILHRVLQEPPVFRVTDLEEIPFVDDIPIWRLHAIWETEPNDTIVFADWWKTVLLGTQEQDPEENRNRLLYLSGLYMDKRRHHGIVASERQVLEQHPWTAILWVEEEVDGRRVERHWASIVPHADCSVAIETSPYLITTAPANRQEFREKVEQVRQALIASPR